MLVRNRFGMVKYVVMTCLFIKYQFVIDNNHYIYIYIALLTMLIVYDNIMTLESRLDNSLLIRIVIMIRHVK
jgi:hypothetical protein